MVLSDIQPIAYRYCEVCGLPATRAVRDMRQVGVVDGWATFEPDGDWHFYCEECKREPLTVYLEDDEDE
jgi:hypothetical protein